MFSILNNPAYRHLFFAQVLALLGTGLATVALGLLAFELEGAEAGKVLGTALTIKMLAYVFIAPLASALINRLPRKPVLITLDFIRASVALMLPFASEVWHVYLMIFFLQAASASFTPLFQATIPQILTEEKDYTKALSLSRLAYDLENLISPTLAALLLTLMSWPALFTGTVLGFVASALLILSTTLPLIRKQQPTESGIFSKTTRGIRLYLATPRLRGLLMMNIAATCAGAMVIINTVVLVQGQFGLSEQATALALTAFGAGSMLAALTMPSLLNRFSDRSLMLAAAASLGALLLIATTINGFTALVLIWGLFGIGYSAIQTPSGRLITRSSGEEDRADLFAAQFSLSHSCWLLAYPAAGWFGTLLGTKTTFAFFALITFTALGVALYFWPTTD